MKLVDRYIIISALRVMLATFAIGVGVLTLARLIIILKLKAIDDQDFGIILRMLGYFLPNYFGFMLPFALFWACFMVTRRLSGNSEIRAFNAAGISQKRLMLPFFILSLLTVIANFAVYGWLEPIARYNYRHLTHQIENTAAYLAAQAGVFMKAGRRTVYIDEIDRQARTFKGLLIYEQGDDGILRQIISARGQLINVGPDSLLRLEDGNRIRLKPVDLASASVEKPDENLLFQTLDIPLVSDEDGFHSRGNDEEELTIRELASYGEAPPAGVSASRMSVQLQHKLIVILTALILPFLAIAMAQSGPRGSHYLKGPTAFLLVILYQQLVEFGKVFAREHELQASLVLWPVFIIMAVLSVGAFLALDASRSNWLIATAEAVGRRLQFNPRIARQDRNVSVVQQ